MSWNAEIALPSWACSFLAAAQKEPPPSESDPPPPLAELELLLAAAVAGADVLELLDPDAGVDVLAAPPDVLLLHADSSVAVASNAAQAMPIGRLELRAVVSGPTM